MPPSVASLVPIAIGVLALLFTIFSFWWMNWRRGKLNVGSFRMFAAGKGVEGSADSKNLVIVSLPLVLWNSGARPLLVCGPAIEVHRSSHHARADVRGG
jgi:hypothetical protein